MYKKILSTLLCVCMLLSLLPVTALADGEVAEIGGTQYMSLADAVADVPADGTATTITLLSDAIDGAVIAAGQNVVLDLNSKEVNVSTSSGGSGVITVDGKLTIRNGTLTDTVSSTASSKFIYVNGELNIAGTASLVSSGYVIYGTSGGAAITTSGNLTSNGSNAVYINSGNSLTIGGGTITAASGSKKSCVLANGGSITMNGGTLLANSSDETYCIKTNGQKVGAVNVYGGTLTAASSKGYCVYWNSAGTLTIGNTDGTGPTLTAGDTAIEVKCTSSIVGSGNTSTVIVQGGTLSGTKYALYQNSSDVASTSFANVTLGNVYLRTASSLTDCTVNGKLTLSGMTQCDFENAIFADGGSLSSGRYYLENGTVKETPSYTVTFATNNENLGKIGIKSYRFYSAAAGTSSGSTASPSGESSHEWSALDGSEAKVVAIAMPESGSAFVGWFDNAEGNGNPIATSTEVTYEADADGLKNNVSYYAVFKTSDEYNNMVAAANAWVAGYDSQAEFTIGTISDMQSFAYAVNYLGKDFSGKTVKLNAGLAYTDTDSFTPIGTETTPFKGTFDGGKNTITGLSFTGTKGSGYIGLFGCVDGATIKDLTLTGVNFDGGYMTGGFAGEAKGGSFINCAITDSALSNGYFLGGIFGHSSTDCTVTGCRVEGVIFNGYWKTGGVVGYADGVKISDTTVTDIEALESTVFGALVGHANSGATKITDVKVSNVKDENGEKALVIGTTYSSGNSQTITVDGKDTNIDAAGIVPSESTATIQVSGGDFTFEIPSTSSNKISVTFKNGDDIVIVRVIDKGSSAALPEEPAGGSGTFLGWYLDDGTQVTADTKFSSNATVSAKWRSNSSSPSYRVTVSSSTGGDVTVTPSSASKGLTITVKVNPDDGYALDTLTVTDASGNELSLNKRSETEYSFTMPGSAVTVKATFVNDEGEVESGLPFDDVDVGDWFYDAVKYAYENSLMNGLADDAFAPNSTLTRGMMATLLYRLEGEPDVTGVAFDDIGTDMWYTDAITWAAANGIVNGYGDGVFAPNDAITREQLAAILYRYAQYKGLEAVNLAENLTGFDDAESVSEYAVSAMNWAVGAGLMNGVTDTTLQPQGTATRAQVATMLMRFIETF